MGKNTVEALVCHFRIRDLEQASANIRVPHHRTCLTGLSQGFNVLTACTVLQLWLPQSKCSKCYLFTEFTRGVNEMVSAWYTIGHTTDNEQ